MNVKDLITTLRALPQEMQVVVAVDQKARRFRFVDHSEELAVRSVAWDACTLEIAEQNADDYTVEKVLLLRPG